MHATSAAGAAHYPLYPESWPEPNWLALARVHLLVLLAGGGLGGDRLHRQKALSDLGVGAVGD